MSIKDRDEIVILLATFNGARFLADQLQSFEHQHHKNWKLVVSDDGSDDATLRLVEQFKIRVAQEVTIIGGPQLGFWQNFVSLLRLESSASYFSLSDQDDIWLPTKLTRALGALRTISSGVPAVYFSRTQLIDTANRTIGMSPLFLRPPGFRNALVQSIGGGNTMVLNRAAYHILKKVPPDTAIVSHDWWVYQMITGVGGVAIYDPTPSLSYRQHGNNLVGANRGLSAQLSRLRALLRKRIVRWNDINEIALNRVKHLLTEDNRNVLDQFTQARRASPLRKIALLVRSGVYRQTLVQTIGLYVGALLGRI